MESVKKMVTELAEKVKKLENVDNTKTIEKELCCRKFSKKIQFNANFEDKCDNCDEKFKLEHQMN